METTTLNPKAPPSISGTRKTSSDATPAQPVERTREGVAFTDLQVHIDLLHFLHRPLPIFTDIDILSLLWHIHNYANNRFAYQIAKIVHDSSYLERL